MGKTEDQIIIEKLGKVIQGYFFDYRLRIRKNLDKRTPTQEMLPKGRARMVRLDTAWDAIDEVPFIEDKSAD